MPFHSKYTDTGPTITSTDLATPGVWQGSDENAILSSLCDPTGEQSQNLPLCGRTPLSQDRGCSSTVVKLQGSTERSTNVSHCHTIARSCFLLFSFLNCCGKVKVMGYKYNPVCFLLCKPRS